MSSKLVTRLLVSGKEHLDTNLLASVKEHCRASKENSEEVYRHASKLLTTRKHSQVRYSCIQLMHELFIRSSAFRECVLANLPVILESCVSTSIESLPPPKEWAAKLRMLTFNTIRTLATDKRFRSLGQLKVALHYCQTNITDTQDSGNPADVPLTQRDVRSRQIRLLKYRRLTEAFPVESSPIRDNLTALNQCIEMLVPSMGISDAFTDAFASQSHYRHGLRSYGLGNASYSLDIRLPQSQRALDLSIRESPENKPIYDSLRECLRLVETSHLPQLQLWEDIVSKADSDSEKREIETFLKELIDLKRSVLDARLKASDILKFSSQLQDGTNIPFRVILLKFSFIPILTSLLLLFF